VWLGRAAAAVWGDHLRAGTYGVEWAGQTTRPQRGRKAKARPGHAMFLCDRLIKKINWLFLFLAFNPNEFYSNSNDF
jgi:hypothetical protein